MLVTVGFATAIRERAREFGREPGPDDLEPVNPAAYRYSAQIAAQIERTVPWFDRLSPLLAEALQQ